MLARTVVAVAALAVVGCASAHTPHPSGGQPLPPAAVAAGYTLTTLDVGPMSATGTWFCTPAMAGVYPHCPALPNVDTSQTFGSSTSGGFDFYLNDVDTSVSNPGVTISTTDGSMTILGAGPSHTSEQNVSTAAALNTAGTSPYYVGWGFGCGFYLEVTASVDAPSALSYAGQGQIPAGFMEPLEVPNLHLQANLDWPNQTPTAYRTWVEPDFFEYSFPQLGLYNTQNYTWWNAGNPACASFPNGTCFWYDAQHATPPIGTNLSGIHTYGLLWIPATPTTSGTWADYLDDVQTNIQTYTQFVGGPSQLPPALPTSNMAAEPWRLGMDDSAHPALLLSNAFPVNFTIYRVAVYQNSSSCNLHN